MGLPMRGRLPCHHESSNGEHNTNSQCYVTSRKSVAASPPPAATTASAGSATTCGGDGSTKKEFKGLNDRSSVPHHQPTKTDPEVNREDPLASPAVSFRAAEDLDVPRPLPRRHHQPIGCLAHPAQARPQPTTGVFGATNARTPGGNATRKNAPATNCKWTRKFIEPLGQTGKKKRYYLLHRNRRLHAIAGPARLPSQRPEGRDRNSSTTSSRNCRSRSRRSKRTTGRNSAQHSTGTSSTWASDTSRSDLEPHA